MNQVLRYWGIIVVIIGMYGCASQSKEELYINKGDTYAWYHDYGKAMGFYEEALLFNPQSAPAHVRLGWCFLEQKKYEAALVEFNKALECDPQFYLAYYGRGALWIKKVEHDKAAEDLRKALEINPRCYEAYIELGNIYFGKGDWDQAIRCYAKAIEGKIYKPSYHNRALCYYNKGEYNKSIEDNSSAIYYNTTDFTNYRNRGQAYNKVGRYDDAIADYNEALDIYINRDKECPVTDDPSPKATMLIERGVSWAYKDRWEKAIDDFTQAIRSNPRSEKAWFYRGCAWYGKCQIDRALRDMKEAMTLNPRFVPVLLFAADVYSSYPDGRFRDGTRALDLANQSLTLQRSPQSIQTFAAALAELSRYADACTEQQEVIAMLLRENKPTEAATAQVRLETYRAQKPWRDVSACEKFVFKNWSQE